MKQIYNQQQPFKKSLLFHEVGSDQHIDGIAEAIRSRTETAELSDDDIHDLAHRFAELVTTNEAFAAAFEEAIGELAAGEVETWAQTLEAHLRTEAEQYEMLLVEVIDEYPDLPSDPTYRQELQNLAITNIDFTPENRAEAQEALQTLIERSQQIENVIGTYESDIQVPEALLTEDFQTELRTMALQSIDFDQSEAEVTAEVEAYVDAALLRLRTNHFNQEVVGTGEIVDPENPEGEPTVADTLRRIIEEDYEPSERIQGLLDDAETLRDQAETLRAELVGANGADAERIREELAEIEATIATAEEARDEEREQELTIIAGLMAGHTGGFGLDDDGNLVPLTEDSMREFYEDSRTARDLPADTDPETITSPVTRDLFNQMPPAGTDSEGFQWSEPPTLADLFRWLREFIYGGEEEDDGPNGSRGAAPTDQWGNPLPNSVPRGNTRAAENSPNHVPGISLNEAFYGPEMVAEFRSLPDSYHQAAQAITANESSWGEGDIMDGDPESISGWKLSVMRHAINAQERGIPFSADRPFFANDLATRRALIYYPGGQVRETTCVGGSGRDGQGGISNVNNSYGSPLGSFQFRPETAHRNNNHAYYRAQATVEGFEPMRDSFRVHHEQGGNIDPSSGNTNSADRAILMHGVREGQGSTWGCWGVPGDVAIEFADAIDRHGGANGEAFVSVS